jgi:8-amino-3,8-dideoxy-alpha-D-manno-octulosonate transaminase
LIPDPEGDSATFLAFNLPAEEQTKAFQKALKAEGIDSTCFKDNFWHYVPNWEHFLAKSTAQTKSPFTDPRNRKVTYSRKSIPRAEDILGRTLVMGVNVKMPASALKALRKGIANAAKAL